MTHCLSSYPMSKPQEKQIPGSLRPAHHLGRGPSWFKPPVGKVAPIKTHYSKIFHFSPSLSLEGNHEDRP